MTPFDSCGLDVPKEDVEALKELVRKLKSEKYPARCVAIEVGTWTGRTTLAMIEAGMDEVHCIDSWKGTECPHDQTYGLVRGFEPGYVYEVFKKNIGELFNTKVFAHKGYSADLVKEWSLPVDFLFIDADHGYEPAKHDILEWGRFVTKGGIICGHDFNSWEGVNQAVRETGEYAVVGASIWWRRVK